MDLSGLIKELKAEKDLMQRHLTGIDKALAAFAGAYITRTTRKRRKMSAKSRAKIAAAQRRRWAKVRAKQKG